MCHLNKDTFLHLIDYCLIDDHKSNFAKALLFGSKRSRQIFLLYAMEKIKKVPYYCHFMDMCLPDRSIISVKARSWKKAYSGALFNKKILGKNFHVALISVYTPGLAYIDFNIILDVPFTKCNVPLQ